jgi:WD40 repeat protein
LAKKTPPAAPAVDAAGLPMLLDEVARFGAGGLPLPSPVGALAVGPGGARVAAVDGEGTLHLLEADGRVVRRIAAPFPRPRADVFHTHLLRLSRDGRVAAVRYGAVHGPIAVFDLDTGEPLHTDAEPHHQLALSPDGTLLASSRPTWSELRRLRGAPGVTRLGPTEGFTPGAPEGLGWAEGPAFSPDGQSVALAFFDPLTRAFRHVTVLDAATARPVRRLDAGEDAAALQLAYLPDGRLVALTDKGVRFTWGLGVDAPERAELGTSAVPADVLLTLLPGVGEAVVRRADGQAFRMKLAGGARTALPPLTHPVACADDGSTVATAEGVAIRLWDAATGAERTRPPESPHPVVEVVFALSGAAVVTRDAARAQCWDLKTRALRAAGPGAPRRALHEVLGAEVPLAVAASGAEQGRTGAQSLESHDRRWVASCDPRGNLLVELRGPLVKRCKVSLSSPVRTLAFSPDGTLLAAACTDRTLRLVTLQDGRLGALQGGHLRGAIRTLAFSQDGTMLASGDADGVCVWRVAGLSLLAARACGARSLAFSPGGAQLAVGGEAGWTLLQLVPAPARSSGP